MLCRLFHGGGEKLCLLLLCRGPRLSTGPKLNTLLTTRGCRYPAPVTTRAAKPAAMGLLGQSGALSVSGTACRPRRDPPGVPRGYRGSGPMVFGV